MFLHTWCGGQLRQENGRLVCWSCGQLIDLKELFNGVDTSSIVVAEKEGFFILPRHGRNGLQEERIPLSLHPQVTVWNVPPPNLQTRLF